MQNVGSPQKPTGSLVLGFARGYLHVPAACCSALVLTFFPPVMNGARSTLRVLGRLNTVLTHCMPLLQVHGGQFNLAGGRRTTPPNYHLLIVVAHGLCMGHRPWSGARGVLLRQLAAVNAGYVAGVMWQG